jgi:hypothetical protein
LPVFLKGLQLTHQEQVHPLALPWLNLRRVLIFFLLDETKASVWTLDWHGQSVGSTQM